MEYYNGNLRLGGSLHNEIPKLEMSAAEVVLLRAIHGSDAVVGLTKTGERRVSQSSERDRLRRLYGGARNKQDQRIIDLTFPSMAPLPEVIFDGVQEELDLDDDDAEDDVGAPPAAVAAQATKRQQRAARPVDLGLGE